MLLHRQFNYVEATFTPEEFAALRRIAHRALMDARHEMSVEEVEVIEDFLEMR